MKTAFVFISIFLICFSLSIRGQKKINEPILHISINSSDSTIKINEQLLPDYSISTITKIFGKPDRIEEYSYDSYIEEFPVHKGESPSTYPITVKNFYYIYDKLGIMFYTQNGEAAIKEPTRCIVYFKNKRTFTNTKELPFKPKNNFIGNFSINGDTIILQKKSFRKL